MPRSVIYVETAVDHISPVEIVNLGPHQISQTHRLAAKFWEGQRQPALSLAVGIIDDGEMSGAIVASRGKGDEVLRGPIAGPGRLRMDLRPGAVAKRTRLQNLQYPGVERGNFGVC